MTLLRDLINYDPKIEFVNDVQLKHFRSKQNLSLLRHYIFTRNAVLGKKSSTELLRKICESFLPGNHPNRFVFQATYGHGKSHFALAAANFFGKSLGSIEIEIALDRLKHSLDGQINDAPAFAFFENFKKNFQKPFLILILTGEDGNDLPTKFFQAIEDSLKADENDDVISPSFWYKNAEKALEDLLEIPSIREKLTNKMEFVDGLFEQIRNKKSEAIQKLRKLFEELGRVPPDLSSGVDLEKAIKWLAENAVGEDKPYAGILILFDEFLAFIQDFARHKSLGTPLQSLLNGVDSSGSRVCFCAFAQRDPDAYAKVLFRNHEDDLKPLLTQLNRLPTNSRYDLHSCLEEVLDAYLRQNKNIWSLVNQEPLFSRKIGSVNDLAYDIFEARYSEELGWTIERFQQIVSQGCFPLHPITTALLASIDFGTNDEDDIVDAAQARRLLSFVSKSLKPIMNTEVIKAGQINWIKPLELIDYFQERLGASYWRDYKSACQQAGAADAPERNIDVLKAILLIQAGKLKTRGAYDRVVAAITDLKIDDARSILTELANQSCIQFNPIQKTYTFWPAGRGKGPVDEMIGKKRQLWSFDFLGAEKLQKELEANEVIANINVPISWGNESDWYLKQYVLPASCFNIRHLQTISSNYLTWSLGEEPKARGLVVWVIPGNESELEGTKDIVSKVLSEQKEPVAIIVNIHNIQIATLRSLFGDLMALSIFTPDEVKTVGKEQFEARKKGLITQLRDAFKLVKDYGSHLTIFHESFSGRLNAIKLKMLPDMGAEVFAMAYAEGPRKWGFDYALTSTSFQKEVILLASLLCENCLSEDKLSGHQQAKDICKKGLQSVFGTLTSDWGLQKPFQNSDVFKAWQLLEEEFPPDKISKRIEPVITKLLNSPYGFDYYTLLLLLSSWWGYFNNDLQLIDKSCTHGFAEVFSEKQKPLKNCKAILRRLGSFSLRRTPANEIHEKMHLLCEKIESGKSFTKQEATNEKHALENYLKRSDLQERSSFEECLRRLTNDLIQNVKFERESQILDKKIREAANLHQLVGYQTEVRKLVEPRLVKFETPKIDELLQSTKHFATAFVKSGLQDIQFAKTSEKMAEVKAKLESLLDSLRSLEYFDLIEQVSLIIKKIEEQIKIAGEISFETKVIQKWLNLSISGLRISELVSYKSELENCRFTTNEIKNKQEIIFQDLQKEISRLMSFRDDLDKEIKSCEESNSLRSIINDIRRLESRFDDEKSCQILSQALNCAEALVETFTVFEKYQKENYTNPYHVELKVREMKTLLNSHEALFSVNQKTKLKAILKGAVKFKDELEEKLGKEELERLDKQTLRGFSVEDLSKFCYKDLKATKAWLEKLSFKSDYGLEIEKIALEKISSLMDKIVEDAENLALLVENEDDELCLEKIAKEITNFIPRVSGVPSVEQRLKKSLAKLGKIQNCYSDLMKLEKDVLSQPSEAMNKVNVLREIIEFSKPLGEKQRKYWLERVAKLEKIILAQTAKTEEWLEKIGIDFLQILKMDGEKKTGNLSKILNDCLHYSGFINNDILLKKNALVDKIQELIDQDAVLKAEIAFKQIKNESQRRSLLKKLLEDFEVY
jgi:hypothetical protein